MKILFYKEFHKEKLYKEDFIANNVIGGFLLGFVLSYQSLKTTPKEKLKTHLARSFETDSSGIPDLFWVGIGTDCFASSACSLGCGNMDCL